MSSDASLGLDRKPRPLERLRARVGDWVAVPRVSSEELGTDWVLAPDSRRSRLACRAVAALTFAAFMAYFGLLCFRHDWGGDFQLYCAAVSRLYENLLHPGHEAVTVPGTQSFAFSPYLVFIGALGQLLGASPYRALQVAGFVNLLLFSVGAGYLFYRHSIHRRWELPAACFLFVTLFVRWQHFGWSSETSLISMQYLQAYPSMFAWGLAFFVFGLMKGVAEEGRRTQRLALGATFAVLLLTHTLTASWTVGILSLYALVTAVRRRQLKPLIWTLVPLALAAGVGLLWPYSPLLGQSSIARIREPSPFGKAPFSDLLNLYCLALPCAAYLMLRLRRHGFWLLGLAATLAALMLWRWLGLDYGNRYAFFMAFFAQFMLAEVMALGLLAVFRPLVELSPSRASATLDRPAAILVLAATLVAWVPSPMWKEHGSKVWSPVDLLKLSSPHDAYYAKFPELRRYLSRQDVLLMPSSHLVFDVASLTGARFVSAPYTVRVPDQHARARDVRVFFDPATAPAERLNIAQRSRATKVLVLNWQFNLIETLTQLFGPALYRDQGCALFDATARSN